MSGNPVVWFEIYVKDMDRAKGFYEAVFQVTLQSLGVPSPEMEMWAFPGDQTGYGTPGALISLVVDPEGNLVGLRSMA